MLTFMQMSDVHVGNPDNRPVHTRLNSAVALINRLKPAFVIDSGDVTTCPVRDHTNAEYMAELAEYRTYISRLTMPIYIVPGNHDIGYFRPTTPRRPGEPWGDHKVLAAAFENQIGPLDSHFVRDGFQFILVNNNPSASREPSHLSAEQLAWIEQKLRGGERAFIFCHVQTIVEGHGETWGPAAEKLMALCREYGVAVVSYGHWHDLHVEQRQGTQYIMCPDLKVIDHFGVLEYRLHRDRFELRLYDVRTGEHQLLGVFPYPEAPSRRLVAT